MQTMQDTKLGMSRRTIMLAVNPFLFFFIFFLVFVCGDYGCGVVVVICSGGLWL